MQTSLADTAAGGREPVVSVVVAVGVGVAVGLVVDVDDDVNVDAVVPDEWGLP